jgi:hypothetical protein
MDKLDHVADSESVRVQNSFGASVIAMRGTEFNDGIRWGPCAIFKSWPWPGRVSRVGAFSLTMIRAAPTC